MLVSQQAHHGVDHEGESDTESLGGASDVEDVGEVLEPTVVETPVSMEARVRAPARAFASFDAVNFTDLFESRANVMRSVLFLTFSEELSAWLFEWLARRFSRGWKLTVK